MTKTKQPAIIAKCKLNNGKIVKYDMCQEQRFKEWFKFYAPMKYLGKGIVHSMNDKEVEYITDNKKEMHFWSNT